MKSRIVKFFCLILAATICLSVFAGCDNEPEPDTVAVRGVSLNLSEYTFTDFESKIQLIAVIQPSNATNPKFTWTIADPSVVSIDENNKVNPIGNGTTTITATTEDGGYTASCTITVNVEQVIIEPTVPVTGVILSHDEYTLKGTGSTFRLEATVTPFSATNQNVIWSTSDSSIATVDTKGLVTPLKKGTVIISATTVEGGFTASCELRIETNNQSATEAPTHEVVIKDPEFDEDGYFINDKLATYRAINSDAVAWVMIPGTNINIPVMQQTKDPAAYNGDDDWYLTHDVNNKKARWGAAYMKVSTIGSHGTIYNHNTVIYGHAGGKYVFDQLEDVTRTQKWFEKESNRYVYINTAKEQMVWQVFACYYTDSDKNYYIQPDWLLDDATVNAKLQALPTSEMLALLTDKGKYLEFSHDNEKFAAYMNDWRSRLLESYSDSSTSFSKAANMMLKNRSYGVSVLPTDKVLTLSTCADAEGPVRYVLCAKLIKCRARS